MQIENRNIDELIPYEFNNRTHGQEQVDRIANSISSFGFNQPIVVDEQNVILVGHGRFLAAKKLGLSEVPTLKKSDLNETQKRAYRILDNKLQNESEWDFENLEVEIGNLEELGFDLEPWGLDDLIPSADADGVVEDDFDPKEINEPFIKRGDLIELGAHRLLCGSSENADDLNRLFAGCKIDLLLTDPPYNLASETELYAAQTKNSKAHNLLKASDWDHNFHPSNFINGVFPFFGENAWIAIFTSHFLFGEISGQLKGLTGHSHFFVWCKPNPMPSLRKKCFTSAVELCVLSKKGSPYFDYPAETNALNYIVQPAKGYIGHPTSKSVPVISELMVRLSRKGATVADVFMGSGTTLIAAEMLGRICYGLELDPKYCQLVILRFFDFCEKNGREFACRINGELIPAEFIRQSGAPGDSPIEEPND